MADGAQGGGQAGRRTILDECEHQQKGSRRLQEPLTCLLGQIALSLLLCDRDERLDPIDHCLHVACDAVQRAHSVGSERDLSRRAGHAARRHLMRTHLRSSAGLPLQGVADDNYR